jgi:hypothetical protein
MRILAHCVMSDHWHITGQTHQDRRWSSLGGGAVRQAHDCAGVDAEACATGPMASSPGWECLGGQGMLRGSGVLILLTTPAPF